MSVKMLEINKQVAMKISQTFLVAWRKRAVNTKRVGWGQVHGTAFSDDRV